MIQKLAGIRRDSTALRHGSYRQLFLNHQQLAFARQVDGRTATIMINAADKTVDFEIPIPFENCAHLVDKLNNDEIFETKNGRLSITVYPRWARILMAEL